MTGSEILKFWGGKGSQKASERAGFIVKGIELNEMRWSEIFCDWFLQSTARPVLFDALTQAECKEGSKKLDEDETTRDSNNDILVVFEMIYERFVTALDGEKETKS